MKLQYFFLLLVIGLFSIQTSNGFSLSSIFSRTTKKPSTTATPSVLTEPGTRSTNQPGVPQNVNSKTCWWTQCSSRCPGGSQVAGASICEGQKGVYKFNCCQA